MLGYALRRSDDPDDAADAVGETFLIAWRRFEDVPTDDRARAWLYGTARRVLANQRRGSRRRDHLAERLASEARIAVATVQPETGSDADAARAFRRLKPAQRELLALVAWEGLAPRELATALGCSVNAAKIRLHRARRAFARELERDSADTEVKPDSASGHSIHAVAPRPVVKEEL